MKLVTLNIQYSFGRDGVSDLTRQADLVADADIIAFQEVERHWARTGDQDQAALLAGQLDDRYHAYGPGLDVDASQRAGSRVINRRRQFGVMTLSRWPILSARNFPLPKIDDGITMNTATSALETVIAAPGGPIRLINLHLSHVSPRERLLQLEALKTVLDRAGAEGGVWSGSDPEDVSWHNGESPPPMPLDCIVMGDFNAEPGSDEWRFATSPNGLGLIDSHMAAPQKSGNTTFFRDPAQGAETDMRIDFIMISPPHLARLRSSHIDEATRYSDHQPVWIDLAP